MFFQCKSFDSPGYQEAGRVKNGSKCGKLLSVAPYISGTIHHMIFIYGTHVCIKG